MAYEAPEGIVFYSYIDANGQPVVDYGDLLGSVYQDTHPDEVLGLSKSQIETLDLISEGPIKGLVSGNYIYSGTLGNVGWTSVTFSGFNTPTGYNTSQFLRSIYWNEIPVLNDVGKFNFQNINVKFTEGKPNGEAIQVLSPFQTVSRSIGERLRFGPENAKIYRVFNKDCRGVVINVKLPSLAEYEPNTGDVRRTTVDYSISYRPIFSNKIASDYIFAKSEKIFGKIVASNGYIRTTRIDFSSNFLKDVSFVGWEVKIERGTADASTTQFSNQTIIDSITEIQGNIYTFPNSSMVRSLFDAEYFNSVPERSFEVELLKVKVPGNYNPLYRTYNTTGFATVQSGWNGEFATGRQYTNNPAWCYYDLLTNKRYGLGKYIDADLVDKTSLYEIGKYCDTLVNDGYGGLEPRFTCNTWIASREEAYKVVNDMASVFRGLTYYANGLIFATQDSPKDSNVIFTNANVEEGNFSYSTSSRKTRNSVAIVRYNDPKNFYRPAVEYVEDFDAIRKYGVRETELTAFACSSRGQAIRLGRWALLTDKLEPEIVTLTAGIGEASYLQPGYIFKVHDSNRKTKRYGGRTVEVKNINDTGTTVVLDYKIETEPTVEYKISFLTPSFVYNPAQVTGLNSNDYGNINKSFLQEFYFSGFQANQSGSRMVVDLNSGFDYNNYLVTGGQVWVMELSPRYANYTGARYFTNTDYDYYRTINITEKETHKFEIVGLQYNPQKYIEIESGLLFQKDVQNQIQVPANPYNLNLNITNLSENQKKISYSFLIDDLNNVDSFKVYVKNGGFVGNAVPESKYLYTSLPSNMNYGDYYPSSTGSYVFRVYASNDKQGILSPTPAINSGTIFSFDPVREIFISALAVSNVTGIYSGNASNNYVTVLTDNDANPVFRWQAGSNNAFVSTGSFKYRATVRQYGDGFSRIPTTPFVYQESGITANNWTFTLAKNITSSGGPYRDYQVVIEAYDANGKTSAGNQIGGYDYGWANFPNGYDILSISNPRQTGFELKTAVPTQATGYGVPLQGNLGFYNNYAYISPNGGITINFTSGNFDADLVGGYLYVSTGVFPKLEAAINTGFEGLNIGKFGFTFDPLNPIISHPTAAISLLAQNTGFVSFSLYDAVDKALIDRGINISTGLYISNNAVIYNESVVGTISIGNQQLRVKKYIEGGIDGGGGYGGDPIDYNVAVLIASGTADGITSILYMYPSSGSMGRW